MANLSRLIEDLKLHIGKETLVKNVSMVLDKDKLFEKYHLLPFCEFTSNDKIVTYFPTAFDEEHRACWKYWKFNNKK
jgi:hypothetical protein